MWPRLGIQLKSLRHRNVIGICPCKYVISSQKYVSTSRNKVLYAQPLPRSHPHLLKNGEITPGLSSDVYRSRRNNFMKIIKERTHSPVENCHHHLIVIPSSSVVYMSENIPYPFRQFTDFLYLCGYKEANSVLVMKTSLEIHENECILFIQKPTIVSERWEGKKMDLQETKDFLAINQALYIDEFENFLQSYAKCVKRFTLWYDFSGSSSRGIHETMRSFIQSYAGFLSLESPRLFLHKCRLLKCKFEADLMRRTCNIGAEAMREVIKFSRPGILESHLQAKMEYECRIRGADSPAFPPVVGGGSRANTIHYIDNNHIVKNNEMVLMDAGCEFAGYCSDLARTWPVNGKFTEPQREIYNLILSIQEQLIEQSKGKPSLDYLFKVMCKLLGKGLQDLDIVSKNCSEENLAEIAYEYCPHHVSHYLGMDVHDTNAISRGIKLLSGMIVTIEPGIYISSNDTRVPEKYRGICVRIEDDVLITDSGVEVLTSACPKHPDDIEKLVQSKF